MAYWKVCLKNFKEYLPVTEDTPALSLQEGNTPLIPLISFSEEYNINAFAKFEGLNPTGSFKDRGMVLAVAKAKEEGAHTVICASTGNTSASAAAYASRLGLNTIVVIPEGKVALGKIAQAIVYGAKIISIQGNFDDALKIVRKIAENNEGVTLVNSVNPYRIECQKTSAFEIVDALDDAPDYLFIPVGNAGTYPHTGRLRIEKGSKLPKCSATRLKDRLQSLKIVIEAPETVGTAIESKRPGTLATDARDELASDSDG